MEAAVTLELLTLEHTQPLYALTVANREYLREWLPWLDHIQAPEDTAEFIKVTMAESAAGGAPSFAVFFHGELCGVAGFHKLERLHRRGELGYWLAQPFQGNGIITEAVRALLVIGFEDFSLHKIEIHCAEENKKSRAIAERLGFLYETTLRQREWLYDHYVDHAVYSMLEPEYRVSLDIA